MSLSAVIVELRRRSQKVPIPPLLPSPEEVAALETSLGISLPPQFKRYLLEASDVVLGTLEPVTIKNEKSHTYLLAVLEAARSMGVPRELIPICEDNSDYYCVSPAGEVFFWSHNGVTNERWPSVEAWLQEVWLGECA